MDEVQVYNTALELVGIVDTYNSLIWANRYADVGDCELYVPASAANLDLLRKDYYLRKTNSDMVCRIKKIELDTSAENGSYLTVTGYDVKRLLDQRVVWDTMSADGNAEAFVRQMVNDALGDGAADDRQIKNARGQTAFVLGASAGFSEVVTEQVSYKNIGEKVREYCLQYGWGYRVTIVNGQFVFELYAGDDKTKTVKFADEYENLATTKYSEDDTNVKNVALVGGTGEGAERERNVAGTATGADRYELFVDAKDVAKTVEWAALIETYPLAGRGGTGYINGDSGTGYVYKLGVLNVQILDDAQLDALERDYPEGGAVTIDNVQYFQIPDVAIADLPNGEPQDKDTATLRDVIYSSYLLARGYEKIAECGSVTSFSGTIEPSMTFKYNSDYYLGDKVTVQNEFGITAQARIVEVVEVNDDNGYSVEPKFEYYKIGG